MGKLGWSPDQALHCDVNAILLGMEGLREFHNPEDPGPKPPKPPVTADRLETFAKRQNAGMASGKARRHRK